MISISCRICNTEYMPDVENTWYALECKYAVCPKCKSLTKMEATDVRSESKVG